MASSSTAPPPTQCPSIAPVYPMVISQQPESLQPLPPQPASLQPVSVPPVGAASVQPKPILEPAPEPQKQPPLHMYSDEQEVQHAVKIPTRQGTLTSMFMPIVCISKNHLTNCLCVLMFLSVLCCANDSSWVSCSQASTSSAMQIPALGDGSSKHSNQVIATPRLCRDLFTGQHYRMHTHMAKQLHARIPVAESCFI